MVNETKKEEILSRASTAMTKRTKVRRDQIQFDTGVVEAMRPGNLVLSFMLEGLQARIEIFVDKDHNRVLIRRNGQVRVLARGKTATKRPPEFTPEMEVGSVQVVDFEAADRLLRSIPDNEVCLSLDRLDQICVSKKRPDASPMNLGSTMDSLTLEGQHVPIETIVHEQGKLVLIKGHRRVTPLRILAGNEVLGS